MLNNIPSKILLISGFSITVALTPAVLAQPSPNGPILAAPEDISTNVPYR